MLVLTRRKNDRIVIHLEDGRRIAFTITAISPKAVKVGVDAPSTLKVLRAELQDQRTELGRRKSA